MTTHDVKYRAHTPEQKREVVERLLAVWLTRPTLRLGQMIGNCTNVSGAEIYNVEDFDLVDAVERPLGTPVVIEMSAEQIAWIREKVGQANEGIVPKFKAGDRVVIDNTFNGPVHGAVRKTRGARGVIVLDGEFAESGRPAVKEVSYGWSPTKDAFWSMLGPVRFDHEPAHPPPEWLVQWRAQLAGTEAGAALDERGSRQEAVFHVGEMTTAHQVEIDGVAAFVIEGDDGALHQI